MTDAVQELLDLIDLERLEVNIYRGRNRDIGSGRVYGGQVLAQALVAAQRTVDEGRVVHSMHGYFILPGDLEAPIVYFVDRLRDGQNTCGGWFEEGDAQYGFTGDNISTDFRWTGWFFSRACSEMHRLYCVAQ